VLRSAIRDEIVSPSRLASRKYMIERSLRKHAQATDERLIVCANSILSVGISHGE